MLPTLSRKVPSGAFVELRNARSYHEICAKGKTEKEAKFLIVSGVSLANCTFGQTALPRVDKGKKRVLACAANFDGRARLLDLDMEAVLDQPVLVLNRLWQAVNTCSVRRAFTLLYRGHAQVVSNDGRNYLTHDFLSWRDFSKENPEPEMVRTISVSIRVPKIIVLLLFERLPKKEVKFTRHNVFERDRNTCQYCGAIFERSDLNLDHVLPRDRGGQTTWENIVCSCIPCNTRKGNKLPHEAGMQLIRKPKRPRWRPFVNITFSRHQHDSWKHFLDLAYWNVELGE